MADSPGGRVTRGVSPTVGIVLMVVIVVILASLVGAMALGLSDRLDEEAVVHDEEACGGFQEAAFQVSGSDYTELLAELQENDCALWLQPEAFETAGGSVVTWSDGGPNGFDATQSDASDRPEVVTDPELGIDVVEFEADHTGIDPDDSDSTSGTFLNIPRDVDELDIDEDSGFAIVATIEVDEFDRGGAWTVGEAGVDGREFSMRTCSTYSFDGCYTDNGFSDPEGWWRGQHWDTADVDFQSGTGSAGEWLILTHAFDGDEVVVRVNGQEVARETVDLDLSANRDIQLGRWVRLDDDPHYYFDGRMAEVTIFDRKLEEEEFQTVEEYMSDEHGIALSGPIDS